ncbi:ATP-dependent RNA/DNA helicase IGHMBP2 [Pedobacter sp. CG_S7]|uniref:AAA domain-containing protein n=1 Tax=Pedobacter sp. CG_S7 TaxID=3143930 RepID=UPI0033930AA4
MEYFQRLLALLKLEQDEDLKSYKRLTESSSVAEKRSNGLSWYPIAIKGSEMSRGEYLTVEVERTSHLDTPHQLRFGMPAALFSQHHPEHRTEGIIAYSSGNRLKITLKTDELPDWSTGGKLGIDLLFDNNSYDEMKKAIKLASTADEKSESLDLIKILTGQKKVTSHKELEIIVNPKLNVSQQLAVNKILSANELAIVHGPPGTGKTTTLVQAIKAMHKQNGQQILVVAPSNTAVDLLTEKLADEGLSVLRIGNPARVSEKLMALTLDSKMADHKSMKEIKALKKQANAYKNMAHQYKRNFGRAEKEQRKQLFEAAYQILKEVEKTEKYIGQQVIGEAQIITATLVGSNHYTIRNLKFHTVVVDEAGQALEPACWIPIMKAQKVVFAGDHCQLSPTIKSNEAARGGLSTTLFEKCFTLNPEAVVLLEEQYRMNTAIMGYPSAVFYQQRLKAHVSVADHVLFPGDAPLAFIDTAGCGFDEKLAGTSATNPDEAVFLLKHLTQTVITLQRHYSPENFPSIAIISPYKQQIQVLKDLILHSEELLGLKNKLTVNTIDSFQGQERDLVYISLTRSNAEGVIGFLTDIRRMNVAMTRARKKLVVIGDSATLCRLPFYADFISYAAQLDAHQSAWEFIAL